MEYTPDRSAILRFKWKVSGYRNRDITVSRITQPHDSGISHSCNRSNDWRSVCQPQGIYSDCQGRKKTINSRNLTVTDSTQKTCPRCAEAISTAAKICPHCLADQRKGAISIQIVPWVGLAVWLLIAAGVGVVFYRVLDQGQEFSSVRGLVTVASSEMQFSNGEKGRYVTTVGVITNGSDCTWKEVQLEVRYFDQQGKLIDVGAQWFSDVIVQSHAESAFRIRTIADQSDKTYASHRVMVRTATDIKRWP